MLVVSFFLASFKRIILSLLVTCLALSTLISPTQRKLRAKVYKRKCGALLQISTSETQSPKVGHLNLSLSLHGLYRVDHINTKPMFIDKLCHLTHVRLLMIQRLPLPNICITRAHFAKYLYKGYPHKDKFFCGCRLENDRILTSEWMKIKGNEVWI